MDLYHQIIFITIAAANLAVTVWLLRLLIPIWRTLQKVMTVVDNYDFDRLAKQFLNDQKPLSETVQIKVQENKEEGYKEIAVTRVYMKPLDVKEVWEGVVRQMAQEMQ
jgi:hypothetical protein